MSCEYIQPEDKKSGGEGGAGEDVEDSQAEEGQDVLQVVQVGATHSFYILVHLGLVEK